jgi:hypothetical protein
MAYLRTARRYRWLLLAVLALIWGAGLVSAYYEYSNTYESEATIWVLRPSPELMSTNTDDPNLPVLQTEASTQAELLKQLIQTNSFLHDVVARTSLRPAMEAASDERRYLDQIRKRFRVQVLGTNLLGFSFAARDPQSGPEMLNAALAVREERVAQARLAATAAISTVYQREFAIAQNQAEDAQRALQEFDATHEPPLNAFDERKHSQLQLSLDLAQVRLADLKGRIDRSVVAPAVVEVSGMEFQVVDQPRQENRPRGGERAAVMGAGLAIVCGILVAALLVFLGTLLAERIGGVADLDRLAPATVFAAVPQAPQPRGRAARDLRADLAVSAFGERQRGQAKTKR